MDNPCWKGYQMVGTKTQDGKRVPNCVPEQEDTSADREWGTDSLARTYRRDTPGQQDEAADPNDEIALNLPSPKYTSANDHDWTADMLTHEHIVKVGNKYRLVSKKGGKNLGTYPTKAGAEKRERQVQYFKHHEDTAMSIPSFKTFMREMDEQERINLNSTSDGIVTEITPPGMEAWVTANKSRFKKEYGDADGERILFATAWDMYHKGKSEASRDVRMTEQDVPLRTTESIVKRDDEK